MELLQCSEMCASTLDELATKYEKSMTLDPEVVDNYQRYVREGKDEAKNGNMTKSLELFTLAYEIHPSEKLKTRIKKIKEAIEEIARQGSESEGEDEFVDVNNSGLMLFKELHDKLYDHQKEGIAFLFGLHNDGKKGGILADDMGLGKTIQIIAFLSGMYDSELIKHTLLIMPTTLIGNWAKEFAKWTPGMRVKEFHGTNKAARNKNLQKVQRTRGVILTTYQMIISNWELLSSFINLEFRWDYVILDEAHKIKSSSTKTAKSVHAIPAKHRILLTGTPVQNNLREMWALFDFACQGSLLGTAKTFKMEYENPITRAREKDATPGEKALGLKISENLMTIINPYFLRRTKQDVQNKKHNVTNEHGINSEDKETQALIASAAMPSLTRKNDLIVWTYLSQVQQDIYSQFISLDHIKELLTTTRSPLAELTVLKKLCDHPRLLSSRAIAQLGLEEGMDQNLELDDQTAGGIDHVPDKVLVSESGKLKFLVGLLERLVEEGHRTLLFSQSRKMLDIIQRILVNRGFKLMRIDGTITHLAEREKRIAIFQTNKEYSVFLLTTQVGGVGITLTAANRVVIFDPSWNPATDAQAVDRAYRIGQKENVVIYRLVTCGTVEEKIYRRQVFKDSLIRQSTGDKKNPFRYFSRQELKELFKLEDTKISTTQIQLQSLHARQRRTDPQLDEHIAYLHSLEMFGISDHDLMFSHDAASTDDETGDHVADQYIESRVLKAQELMKAESELNQQVMANMDYTTEPTWLRNLEPPKRFDEKQSKTEQSVSTVSENDDAVTEALVVLTEESKPDEAVHKISAKITDLVLDNSLEEAREHNIEYDVTKENELANHSKNEILLDHSLLDVSFEGKKDVLSTVSESEETAVKTSPSLDEKCLSVDLSLEEEASLFLQNKNLNQINPQNIERSAEFCHMPLIHDNSMNDELLPVTLPNSARLSSFQKLDFEHEYYYNDADSKLSLQCDFNLQLEESTGDILEENNSASKNETAWQLHSEITSNTHRPSESEDLQVNLSKNFSNFTCISDDNPVSDDSFIHTGKKKKKTQVLYDSEEEQNSDNVIEARERSYFEKRCSVSSPFGEPFKEIGASTPKPTKSQSPFALITSHRKSLGGNASVASRRSFVEAVVESLEEEEDDVVEMENSKYLCNLGDEEQSDFSVSEEKLFGETLGTEDEEGEEESEKGEDDSVLEESTSDAELRSSEEMDLCAHESLIPPPTESNSDAQDLVNKSSDYENLIKIGKDLYKAEKFKEALRFFLQALDIKSGDPEVQLITIQLYRKLSEC
nr:PREDICTED: DNA excision repair protein ERCC-6-like isoform X1 [Lepisosteus oculatus]